MGLFRRWRPRLGGQLAAAAANFWLATSLLDECSNWIGKALASMDDTDDLEHEMVLRNGLGQSSMFTEGMTSATHANLTRALSLAEAVGSIEHQKRAVHGLWQISLRSVELRKALQLSRRYAEFARSDTDLAATHTANLMVGMSLTYLAEYAEASSLLEQAITIIRPLNVSARWRHLGWMRFPPPLDICRPVCSRAA